MNNVSFNEIIPVSFDPLAKMKSPTVESNYSKIGQIISDRRIIRRVWRQNQTETLIPEQLERGLIGELKGGTE